MRKYDNEIMRAIIDTCEQNGILNRVSEEYYKTFLVLTDDVLEIIVRIIIRDRIDNINESYLTDKWKTNEDLINFVVSIFKLVVRGIVIIDEDGRLGFAKPVGYPPTAITEKLIDEKAHSLVPIVEKVVMEMIKDTIDKSSNASVKFINKETFRDFDFYQLIMTKGGSVKIAKDICTLPFPKFTKS